MGLFGSSDSGIVFGNGQGGLAPISSATTGNVFNQVLNLTLSAGLAVVADFNGDGKPDILSGTTILLNQYSSASVTPPAFALTSSSAAGTVAPGKSATITLTLTPSGGFDANVALSCSGLPAGATCAFSPATASVSGSAATTDTLTISTTPATANVLTRWAGGGMLLAGMLLPFVLLRRPRSLLGTTSRWPMSRCAALLLCGLILGSCGGGGGGSSGSSSGGGSSSSGSPGTSAGTYQVTITATGGSVTQTVTYALMVS
jgi:hypothetical protein